jgi:hypothetical protein
MSKRDGFDIAVGGVKVGSFQTNLQDDGTREMYAYGNGMKLHFGGQVVEGVLGPSFARASNFSGSDKTHAGPGVLRNERSTEALATFIVEEQSRGGPKLLQFVQGQYETAPVVTPGWDLVRATKQLPWPEGCRRAEYGESYDTRSCSTGRPDDIEYSSASFRGRIRRAAASGELRSFRSQPAVLIMFAVMFAVP